METITPIVHINGTSGDVLAEAYERATNALHDALEALCEACPNGRDYYPLGPDAFGRAQKQHEERVTKLRATLSELAMIRESIADQVDRRAAGRGR